MATYKVQKHLRQKARVWGLYLTSFYLFIGISVASIFILLADITVIKVIILGGTISVTYLTLLVGQDFQFNHSPKLPGTIINN